ncbi:MAG: ATP-binding cassette domain-containing protein [Bacillota bacterium]
MTIAAFSLRDVRFKGVLDVGFLEIPAGKITCLVGSSGGGKTSLLRLLNNLASPDQGDIRFFGQPVESYDPVLLRRRVVMLPQVPPVFPGSVGDNLQLALRLSQRRPAAPDRLVRVLSQVSLVKDLDTPAAQLSGGEKQRLALGRVLLLDPDVLLLDEPSSGLDENTERQVFTGLVVQVREGGRTIVMASHSARLAGEFSDRLVHLEGGRVLEVQHRDAGEGRQL